MVETHFLRSCMRLTLTQTGELFSTPSIAVAGFLILKTSDQIPNHGN